MPIINQPAGAGGGSQTAVVTLTATDLHNLAATPVEIVAAPGAGLVVVPLGCILFKYTAGATPFTDHGGQTQICYGGDTALGLCGQIDSGFLDSATSLQAVQAAGGPTGLLANKAVTAFQPIAAVTGGNGTLTISVPYVITDP